MTARAAAQQFAALRPPKRTNSVCQIKSWLVQIIGRLELAHPMRLQAMLAPDALH
jgi:hypothetical protein